MDGDVREKRATCALHGERAVYPDEFEQLDTATGERVVLRHPKAGQCRECEAFNESHGRGKAQRVREPGRDPVEEEYPGRYSSNFDPDDFTRWMLRLQSDPVRLAAFLADGRRPKGVSREQHGVALRRAVREPMLTADPRTIASGLLDKTQQSGRLPKGKPFRYLLVKPACIATSRLGGGWHAREWVVYTLKYAKGLVVVTNKGQESSVFPSFRVLRDNIIKSGWEIVR